jgi:hypothetical protein
MNPLAAFTGPYAQLIRWGVICLFLAGVAGAAALKMHQHDQIRYDALADDFAKFRSSVAALGEQAEKAARTRELEDLATKKRADDENAKTKRDLAGVYDAYRSLRAQRAGGSLLPTATTGSSSPERACFDRAALDRGLADADAILQEGAIGILQRGDQAIVDLNTAKRWAR